MGRHWVEWWLVELVSSGPGLLRLLLLHCLTTAWTMAWFVNTLNYNILILNIYFVSILGVGEPFYSFHNVVIFVILRSLVLKIILQTKAGLEKTYDDISLSSHVSNTIRVPDKIWNRQISEQLLRIRSCVPNSEFGTAATQHCFRILRATCSNKCSEQHQLHSTELKS